MEEIKKSYAEDLKFSTIVEYIEHVEDFKHCTDEIQAAILLEIYNLTLDHVPGHLLKSKEVIVQKENKNSLVLLYLV